MRAAEVTLETVRVGADAVLGSPENAYAVIEHAVDRALAALCAEAVGIMETLNAMTLDYLKTRKQFGVPIGSFQALQHRMADMVVEHEQAKSMAVLAALSADLADTAERRRVISAAKVQIGRSGRFVGQQSIQLHGGIGMTDEYLAGHYFKRLTMIDQSFGDADHHLDRFAEVTLQRGVRNQSLSAPGRSAPRRSIASRANPQGPTAGRSAGLRVRWGAVPAAAVSPMARRRSLPPHTRGASFLQ